MILLAIAILLLIAAYCFSRICAPKPKVFQDSFGYEFCKKRGLHLCEGDRLFVKGVEIK